LKQQTNITLLHERLARNLAVYKNQMDGMGIDFIFICSADIAAYCEIYDYLTGEGFDNENEAAFLLQFDSPLAMLASEWVYHKQVYDDSVGEFVSFFIEDGDTSEFMPVSLVDELYEKYGGDIPLNTACLLELVGMGKSLFAMLETAADYAFDNIEFDVEAVDEGVDV